MTLQLGSRGPLVRRWRQVMAAMFPAYRREPSFLGPLDPGDEFGPRAEQWQKEYERRTGQVQDGIVSDEDLVNLKLVVKHRPIWMISAPGSGVPGFIGPPHDLGEWCRAILNINHVWLDYPVGGYMGLMGGDPKYSYNDIIELLAQALERVLDTNPDVQSALKARRADRNAVVDVELWLSGYSQSADGMKRAVAKLFGPGGKYELLRDRINGLILFGDPTLPGTGIARLVWTAPDWLQALCHEITNPLDFYALADDDIRPLFYEWFVRAEAELPFVEYTAQIILPALLNLVAPFLSALPFGGLTSQLAIPLLGAQTGLGVDILSPIIGGVTKASAKPNPELIRMLSITGLLTNLPQLLKLVMALQGIATHGNYYEPKQEFADPSRGWGPRSGLQVGYDIVAGFRR